VVSELVVYVIFYYIFDARGLREKVKRKALV